MSVSTTIVDGSGNWVPLAVQELFEPDDFRWSPTKRKRRTNKEPRAEGRVHSLAFPHDQVVVVEPRHDIDVNRAAPVSDRKLSVFNRPVRAVVADGLDHSGVKAVAAFVQLEMEGFVRIAGHIGKEIVGRDSRFEVADAPHYPVLRSGPASR
jgi:hypothetical protein